MKKILFPTEFSSHAPQMFHYTLELARRLDCKVLALHAFGKPDPLVTNADDETRERRVLAKLNTFIEQNRPAQFESVEVEPVAYLDYPSDAVLKVAKKEAVSLIVMGMTGQNDEVDKFLGSNALRVLRLAECPILVIPSNLVFKPIERIVFTTNFEYEDIMVLNHLRRAYDGHIEVLHVYSRDKQQADSETKLRAMQELAGNDENLSFVLIKGPKVETAIEQYVEQHKADLLAMTTHKRNLFSMLVDRSLTRNIARDTVTPLFVFKSP